MRQVRTSLRPWIQVGWYAHRLPIEEGHDVPLPGFFGRLGFYCDVILGRRVLFLPCWAVVVATAVLPLAWVARPP